MKPQLSGEKTHCFKHAQTHPKELACTGCVADRIVLQWANQNYPHRNEVTTPKLMQALREQGLS